MLYVADADCHACHLRKTATQVVHGRGTFTARLVIVGEAPGVEEDAVGIPFVGKAGQLLSVALRASQVDEMKLWVTNTYHCRPPKNDISLAQGSPCPSLWLRQEIHRLPFLKVILALGRTAIEYFRPGAERELVREHAVRDTRWPNPVSGPYIVVGSYHPSAALRGNETARVGLRNSIVRATAYLERHEWHVDNDAPIERVKWKQAGFL